MERGGGVITDILPKPQVQASQFQLHISYLLQKCKKGKPPKNRFALLQNDITGSEPTVKILDT
ncbi:unnamed protein product [marine sediment metagenome]|uniref:Uncharacterized protein n=1 Tax=marine sediment metagenome TaxID=412755 RepID=X1DTW1_9ZZZZ